MAELVITERTLQVGPSTFQLSQIASVRSMVRVSPWQKWRRFLKAAIVFAVLFAIFASLARNIPEFFAVFLLFVLMAAFVNLVWVGGQAVLSLVGRRYDLVLDFGGRSVVVVQSTDPHMIDELAILIGRALESPPQQPVVYPLSRWNLPNAIIEVPPRS